MSTLGNDSKNWGEEAAKAFAKMTAFGELAKFINDRSVSHDTYYHYTTVESLKGIMNSNQLWLSDFYGANDLEEESKCKGEVNKYFYISFSSPLDKLESVSMWYLYNQGKGVRLSISGNMLKSINKNPQLAIVDKNTNGIVMELKRGNYNMSIFDIVYYHKFYNSNFTEVRTHNMSCFGIKYEDFKQYIDFNQFGVKDTCWSGEDETRILVTLNDDIRKQLDVNKKYAIAIIFSHQYLANGLHIVSGPECEESILKQHGWQYAQTELSNKIRTPFWGNNR